MTVFALRFKMENELPIVEVVADPAEVAAARKHWAEVRERKLIELLDNPAEIHHFDEESLTILGEQRERSVATLCNMRDDESRPAPARVDAIVALKFLEVPPDPEQLTRLGLTDDDAMLALLHAFYDLFPRWPQKEHVPESYTPFLKAAIKSGNRQIRNSAAYIASGNPRLSVSVDLLQIIRSQPQPELEMLAAAARCCPSAEILGLLTKAYGEPAYLDKNKIIETVATLGQSTDDVNLKQGAAKICFDYLRSHPDDRSYGSEVTESLKLISATPAVENARATLVALVRSSSWELLRPNALEQLLELDPAVATELSKETGIPCVPKPKSEIGGTDIPVLVLADICIKHGILSESEADAAKAEELKTDKGKISDALSFFHCANRLCVFDAQASYYPRRHDLLLLDFATGSAGLLRPEAVVEDFKSNQPETAEGDKVAGPGRWVRPELDEYSLQFIHEDKLYRVFPRSLHRQYDIEATLSAIHRALEDANVADRFCSLADTGACAAFIFAIPFALRAAASELGLVLCDDSFGST
jgi:hypothetical protein